VPQFRDLFVNCDNHSLNVASVHSAKHEPLVITFLIRDNRDRIIIFFSGSTLRWEQLKNTVYITVKHECEIEWSSKSEAVKENL
jgi:hypothetical protein